MADWGGATGWVGGCCRAGEQQWTEDTKKEGKCMERRAGSSGSPWQTSDRRGDQALRRRSGTDGETENRRAGVDRGHTCEV